MDVDKSATTGSAKVGSTLAGEEVPSKRNLPNAAAEPRALNGSKAKPSSTYAVVNVDEEDDDSETEVATLPQGKASSTKGKATILPAASNQSTGPPSYSGTNGHASDSASTRRRPAPSKQAADTQYSRRTDEEWGDIMKHVWTAVF